MDTYTFLSGATGGMGKAFALECAKRGQNLFMTSTKEDKLGELSGALTREYGVSVKYKKCNMADDKDRAELFEFVKAQGIAFNKLINTAGLDYEGPFMSLDSEKIKNLVRVNVESVIDVTFNVLKLRVPDQKFTILTVSSMAGCFPMPLKSMYASSKRMLTNFFLGLRRELKDENASVTLLCPAGVPTNPEWTRSIESQGFVSVISTKNVGYVVHTALIKADKGKAVYIPGFFNRAGAFLGKFLPVSAMNDIIYSRWTKTRAKAEKIKLSDV